MSYRYSPPAPQGSRKSEKLPASSAPYSWLLSFAAAILLTFAFTTGGCLSDSSSGIDPDSPDVSEPDPDPEPGTSDFVSADGTAGQESPDRGNEDGTAEPAPDMPGEDGDFGDGGDDDRTVQEGDIYRILGDGMILNLNSYRGLQVIDFNDLNNPKIIGRAEVSGHPVEMYVLGDQAYLLMNNWRGYYGSRFDSRFREETGGIVIQVDLSDIRNPQLVRQAHVPGNILRSRVVSGSQSAALYVAASHYGRYTDDDGNDRWGTRSYVKSFEITNATLQERSELELGGHVTDIQATPQALLVARWNNTWSNDRTTGSNVRIIDISNPDGTMVVGDDINVRGMVRSQFNMDLYNGILRIASSNTWWSQSDLNWIQTYDASDFSNLVLIDEEPFGRPNEELYATLFLGNKAFFVTYFRTDPFHAFEITDEGIATEMSEFIVSGWNDFFRAVAGQSRLIGIGMNDEGGGQRAAVSLYDITDLENDNPLIDRKEVEAHWTWSEANWDHRAFSVLENAVSVLNSEGDEETGLVLLPFSGYSQEWRRHQSSVQIFTFSADSLTRRGVMDHPTSVRRSFLAEPEVATNLSETDMAFYDVGDPDNPEKFGNVELAPDYVTIIPLGDYAARLQRPYRDWYTWWGETDDGIDDDGGSATSAAPPQATVQIIPWDEHPDMALPIAEFEVPADAALVRSGDLLVAVARSLTSTGDNPGTRIITIDVSDPTAAAIRGDVVIDGLPMGYDYRGDWGGPWGGYSWWYDTPAPLVADDHLIFIAYERQTEVIGTITRCYEAPVQQWCNDDSSGGGSSPGRPPEPGDEDHGGDDAEEGHDTDGDREPEEPEDDEFDGDDDSDSDRPQERSSRKVETCEYYSGHRTCTSRDDSPETCWGNFYRCTVRGGVDHGCELVEDPSEVEVRRECETEPYHRNWNQYIFHPVDLRDPATPTATATITAPNRDQGVDALVKEGKLLYSYKRPVEVSGDSRPFVRYFFREISPELDQEEALGPEINVPGRLIEKEGDTIFTEDFVYGENIVESAVNKLTIRDDRAYLAGRRRFPDARVNAIMVDGAGQVFVNHQPVHHHHHYPEYGHDDGVAVEPGMPVDSGYWDGDDDDRFISRLSVLDAAGSSFDLFSSVPVDRYANLLAAEAGRAFFRVNQGMVIMNADDPTSPHPQAFFPISGWPQRFELQGDHVLFAAGRYGIYRFDSNTFNLLPPPEEGDDGSGAP